MDINAIPETIARILLITSAKFLPVGEKTANIIAALAKSRQNFDRLSN